MDAMRVLSGLAALVFGYLALIPAGLIYSTLDSACAGPGCETSIPSRVLFTLIYSACLAALLGTAGVFAHHAATGTIETQRRLPRALALTGIVVGISLVVLFVFAFPLGGAVAVAVAAAAYLGLRLHSRSSTDAGTEIAAVARGNGHSSNGAVPPPSQP